MKSVPIRGWLAAILVLVASAVCIRLGVWQLDRHAQRMGYNEAVRVALENPAVDLGTLDIVRPEEILYRRVTVRGEYQADAELVWRGRSRDGRPGVHLLTPLRIADSPYVLLVDRGWVPSPDGTRVDPLPFRESGEAFVEGTVQPFPSGDVDGTPMWIGTGADSVLTLRRLDVDLIRSRSSRPVLGFYLQQLPAPELPSPPLRAPLPVLTAGPHLGYAVQWFGFAAVFLVGLAVVVVRR